MSDAEDDSYDLSWFSTLPDGDRPSIVMLRELLQAESDPIDRHFQFAELEARLYRCRELYDTALAEFDEACVAHDAEMDAICRALLATWQKIPLLDTYRQMSIRKQKQQDWAAVQWWAERGLALYGGNAAREDAVEDLQKRRNRALSKLGSATSTHEGSRSDPSKNGRHPDIVETLACTRCGSVYERVRVRGRKPHLCPECRQPASSMDGN